VAERLTAYQGLSAKELAFARSLGEAFTKHQLLSGNMFVFDERMATPWISGVA
jgi:hypothetical protein